MTEATTGWLERAFLGWSGFVRRVRWPILILAPVVTALQLAYVIRTIGVNTDTSSMVAEDLDWRQAARANAASFPLQGAGLTILIDGPTAWSTGAAASELAAVLRADTSTFRFVYQPDSGPFFDRYGLLYRDLDELQQLRERVTAARGMLSEAQKGDLDALIRALEVEVRQRGPPEAAPLDLAPVFGMVAATAAASADGRIEAAPWEALVTGELPTARDRRRAIQALPRLAFDNRVPGRASMDRAREAADQLGLTARNGYRVRLTGQVAVEAEELDTAVAGVRTAGLLAAVSVALILFLALRSIPLIVLCLATLTVGLVATSAFAAFAIGELNLISVAFAVLYVGLGIDYALHLSLRYAAHCRHGADRSEAIDRAVVEVGPSLGLSALTTSACFFAFTTTDFTGVGELGVIGGVGMLVSFVVTLTVLPAGLGVVRRLDRDRVPSGLPRLAAGVARRRRPILALAAIGAVVSLFALPHVEFDENPLNLRDPDSESVRAYRELLVDPVAKPLTISVAKADSAEAAAAAAALQALPEVDQARRLADFVPANLPEKLELLAPLLDELPAYDGLADADPASAEGVDRLLSLTHELRWSGTDEEREMARFAFHALRQWQRRAASWPRSEAHADKLEHALIGGLPDMVGRLRSTASSPLLGVQDLPRDLRDRWVGTDGRHRIEVVPVANLDDNDELTRFVDAVRALEPDATGEAVHQRETGRVASEAFRGALLAAVLITAVLLLVLLRSVRYAALVIVPLGLAALWTCGLVVLLDMPFNFANVIALPLLLGVGVDNGVHIVHHARRADRADPLAASTGRAILFATCTTIASFGNLALATHVGMSTMGRLLTVGMICVLVATLVVIPATLFRPEPPSTASAP